MTIPVAERFVPLSPRIAARVEVPREEVLSPGFSDECLEALDRFGVLVFPRIDFDDAEQVTFSRNLGEIMSFAGTLPDGSPDPIFKISLDPGESPYGADVLDSTIGWHMDGLIEEELPPPRASILSAKRVAGEGGQTEFCNTYAAYRDLSAIDRQRLEPLRIQHSFDAMFQATHPDASPEELAAWRKKEASRERSGRRGAKQQPLVWEHRSGRKSLIVGMMSERVVGMPAAESRALIERLNAHTTRPENVYRHEWRVGDTVMWDNCGVMHRAIPYAADSGRLMHRTTLCGVEGIAGAQAQGSQS